MDVMMKKWGTLGIVHPAGSKEENRYILVIPGFTGDALSHTNFIREAVNRGFGILALTPNWDDSIKTNVEHVRNAMVYISQILPLEFVQIVRANSFGAYLAAQILDINPNISTAIFITPCSATQLYNARAIVGRDIILDFCDAPTGQIASGTIYLLEQDHVAPTLDPYFERAINQLTVQRFNGDHFTAPDQDICCSGALDWLLRR